MFIRARKFNFIGDPHMSSVSLLRFTQIIKSVSCIAALLLASSAGAAQMAAADELAAKNAALALSRSAAPSSANAIIATFTGTTVGAPTYNRGVGCTALSGVGTATPYNAQTFTVPTSGTYNILSSQSGWDGYLHLYQGSFTPGTPLVNCIASNDDFPDIGQSQILVSLTAGTTYILVTSGFSNTDAGVFNTTIDSLLSATVPTLSATSIALMVMALAMLGVFVQRRRVAAQRR